MALTFFVGLDLIQAQSTLKEIITQDSISAKLVDSYEVDDNENPAIISVYEKYFVTASNEASLTTIVDSNNKFTRIHIVAAAGGTWLFNQDFGAEKNFEEYVSSKMEIYKIAKK